MQGVFGPKSSDGNPMTSIAEHIFNTRGNNDMITVMHDIRGASETSMQHTIFGYEPNEGILSDKTMMHIHTPEWIRRHTLSAIIDVLDTIPHSKSATGINLKDARIIVELDPFRYMPQILADLSKIDKNKLMMLVLAIRKSTDDFVHLSGLGGSATIRMKLISPLKHDRIYCIHHALSSDPADYGYMNKGPHRGMGPAEISIQSRVGLNALIERRYNASGPGTYSREGKCVVANIMSDWYGHMLTGPLCNAPRLIGTVSGITNSHGTKTRLIPLSEWISKTPASMREQFIVGNELSRLFKKYTEVYNKCVNMYNNTAIYPGSTEYMDKMESLFAPAMYMDQLEITGKLNMECHRKLVNFIETLPYIMYGIDTKRRDLDVPEHSHDIVRPLILTMLIKYPPKRVVMFKSEQFNDALTYIYKTTVESLLSPWSFVASRAITDLTEKLTQATLDAPKSPSGFATELVKYRNRITMSKSPGAYDIARCIIDEPLPSYSKYIYKTLSALDVEIKVFKELPDEYKDKGYFKYSVDYNADMINIIVRIDNYNIQSAGLSIEIIMHHLIQQFDGYIVLLEKTDKTTIILMQYLASFEKHEYIELSGIINKYVINLPISGIEGINNIVIETFESSRIENGELIKKEVHVLAVETNSLNAMLLIPGVKYEEVIFENGAMQEHYFGTTSAYITIFHHIAETFASQFLSNSYILVRVMVADGKVTALNQHKISESWSNNVMQNVGLSKSKEKLKNAPKDTYYGPTTDIIGASMIGSQPPSGSACGCIIDKHFSSN